MLNMEIPEIISWIKESKYKEDIHKIEAECKYNGIDIIDRAFEQNLVFTLNKLIYTSQDEVRFMITEYLNSCKENNDEIEKYYLNLKKATVVTGDKIFLNFLRRDIDVKNIKALFKAKSGGKDKIHLISGGFEFKDDDLDNLISLSFDEFVDILKNYSYWREIVNEDGKLESDIEASLDSHTLIYTQHMSKCYPLSILPIIDYILRKKAEVSNLRAIMWSKWKTYPKRK